LVGFGNVGKTSLIHRWVKNEFNEHEPYTVGMQPTSHNYNISRDARGHVRLVSSGERLRVTYVDIPGQCSYADFLSTYLKGINGVFIVGQLQPLTDRTVLERWYHKILQEKEAHRLCASVPIIFLLNKDDLQPAPQGYCEALQEACPCEAVYTTSAKKPHHTAKALQRMLTAILRSSEQLGQEAAAMRSIAAVDVTDHQDPSKKKSKCC